MIKALIHMLGDPALMLGLACACVIAACVAALVYLFRKARLCSRPPKRDPQQDQTHMTILFQTMRDLLRSQKQVAQQLNKSMDAKIRIIKEVVDEAKARQEQMGKSQEELARLLKHAREDLGLILGGVNELQTSAHEPREPSESQPEAEETQPEPAQQAPPQPEAEETQPEPAQQVSPQPEAEETQPEPAQQASSRPEAEEVQPSSDPHAPLQSIGQDAEGPVDDFIDNWVGLDFGGDTPKTHAFDIPEAPPTQPSNPDAARAAFRELLNLEQAPETPATQHPTDKAPSSQGQDEKGGGGNGREKVTPLRARVYEYSDAGMTTAQISRELGIGKGEIRLYLNLRKDRGA